ncbi:hypothetical protein NDU88_000542 [Pleurodeles waltl]|uniref:Uncharacterized protein n=1 Tax=Pleurodeles waltl TaxID=8319 RepID=A0AAV7U7G0_PLEWA|nr:hypothetical protein NDU88_000542 [Pleurodeles waltl]
MDSVDGDTDAIAVGTQAMEGADGDTDAIAVATQAMDGMDGDTDAIAVGTQAKDDVDGDTDAIAVGNQAVDGVDGDTDAIAVGTYGMGVPRAWGWCLGCGWWYQCYSCWYPGCGWWYLGCEWWDGTQDGNTQDVDGHSCWYVDHEWWSYAMEGGTQTYGASTTGEKGNCRGVFLRLSTAPRSLMRPASRMERERDGKEPVDPAGAELGTTDQERQPPTNPPTEHGPSARAQLGTTDQERQPPPTRPLSMDLQQEPS